MSNATSTQRDYGAEIDTLRAEISEIKELLSGKKKPYFPAPMNHPDERLNAMMAELETDADSQGISGLITYLGIFASGGRQSNWIKSRVSADDLLTLIENRTAEKVLRCIGNGDRLNILLAILKKPMTVAELVVECSLSSTGQAYHHMKPLLAADLITESGEKGVYIIQPHKVQGIIMLLAGVCDMVDETYTKGTWEE